MKTSDKILLGFCLAVLCIFSAAHLELYARFRQGKITTNREGSEGWIGLYHGKAPAVLFVGGNVNVTLVPSDSFFIDYEERARGQIGLQQPGNDSLIVMAADVDRVNPRGIFQNYSEFPWMAVHAGPHTRILLQDVLALVKGPNDRQAASWDLVAKNSQVWIGEAYGDNNLCVRESYDSVQIDAKNSNLVLHRNSVIQSLFVQLDARSEVNDHHAVIGKPVIRYADSSNINMTGRNLDKLRNK